MTQSIWVIGDVQGCCASLVQLLKHPDLANDPHCQIWFAGDLVNRGPQSLATLRQIMALGDRAVAILGNHDLHLLGVAAGARKPAKSDTLNEILDAPDANEIIDWLRSRPLAHYDYGHLMVHAGVWVDWDVDKTLALAAEVQHELCSDDWRDFLKNMFGNKPNIWQESLKGHQRFHAIVNILLRMRWCSASGKLDFEAKMGLDQAPADLIPWFELRQRMTQNITVVFGHWSTLGLMVRKNAICLDTNCLRGGSLTAIRLQDRKLVQIAC